MNVETSVHDHRADRLPALHQLEALVDALEGKAVRDELVDRDLAFHVPVDDLRHVGAPTRPAEGGALPYAPGDELEGPGRDLHARARHADDDALSPALVAALERVANGGVFADEFEAVVGAAIGELQDGVDHVGHARRVDEVGHAELAPERLARGIQVDADDPTRPPNPRAWTHVQADAAQPEHRDVRAGLDLRGEEHGAHAGGDAATDVARGLEGRVVADPGERDFGNHDVIGEGGGAHVVQDGLAVQAEARGAVGHEALALCGADALAQVSLARKAELALPALGCVERDHVIARLQRGHARADFHHHARALVAEDRREESFGIGAGEREVVGVADAGGLHFHQHFTRLRALELDLLDSQRPTWPPSHGGSRLHGFAPAG